MSQPPASNRSWAGRWAVPLRMFTFDLVGPLVAYRLMRDHSFSTVSSLLVAAAFPAIGVFLGALRDRRLDTIGLTVLLGTGSGAVLSVIVNSPRPTLLFTGVVPIVVFAIACLLSLRRSPLIYEIALAYFGGPHSDRGARFAARWDDEAGFRRYFRRVTTGWGVAYLAEASVKTTIVLTASTGTALVATGALSFVVLGLLAAWMIIYAYVAQH